MYKLNLELDVDVDKIEACINEDVGAGSFDVQLLLKFYKKGVVQFEISKHALRKILVQELEVNGFIPFIEPDVENLYVTKMCKTDVCELLNFRHHGAGVYELSLANKEYGQKVMSIHLMRKNDIVNCLSCLI